MEYELLLKRARERMPASVLEKGRFEIPSVKGHIEGNKTLIINGNYLGCWPFYVIQFGERWSHIDGILGLDFFKRHAIYLDFSNQLAYIHP